MVVLHRFASMGQRWVGVAALGIVVWSVPACGPTAPSPTPTPTPTPTPPPAVRLEIECPPSLLIYERGFCAAGLPGQGNFNPVSAEWSVDPPSVVRLAPALLPGAVEVTGQAGGVATVRATYQGQAASATVTVRQEDGLTVVSRGAQGTAQPGSQGVMDLQGYYAVVSADTGVLGVEIRSNEGRVLASAPRTVSRGGGAYLQRVTFTYPSDSAQVCIFATLRVGALSMTRPEEASSFNCDPVVR